MCLDDIFTVQVKQGQMPIRHDRKVLVTLTLSYFMFAWIISCCETGTTQNLPEYSTSIVLCQPIGMKYSCNSQFEGLNFRESACKPISEWQDVKPETLLWFSFFSEFYHSVTHLTVLTGYRMLPRKDLVRARLYFLLDAACAALAFSLHRVSRHF